MKAQNTAFMTRLNRVARYLVRHPNRARVFKAQAHLDTTKVYVDSDRVGYAETRKSTTGMVVMLGDHTVKHSCNLQSVVSLSSGESK